VGKSNVASVQFNWRSLTHKARLLLDYMALVTIDDDAIPVDVRSWVERAEFLLGGDPLPAPGQGRDNELRRKRAWQAQADAVKQLIEAKAIFARTAVNNETGQARAAFAINVHGPNAADEFSKKILDPKPGKVWSVSKNFLDPIQEIPRSRTTKDPKDPLPGSIGHLGDRGEDRAHAVGEMDEEITVRADNTAPKEAPEWAANS